MALAYSDDLFDWELDSNNPVVWPPEWAVHPGKFGGAWIVKHEQRYLIYTIAEHKNGMSAAGLLSTTDFKVFHDHGPVLMMPKQMRGTTCIELPTVVYRDGIWHMFYNVGEGVWHTVSPTPESFLGVDTQDDSTSWSRRTQLTSLHYFLGRFHAERVFQDPTTGAWYMIYTRKEYQRHLNRKGRVLTPRSSRADEQPLMDGLFLCEIAWEGDQPILKKPVRT